MKKCPLNRVAFCALGPGFTVTLLSVMASCKASAQTPACDPASRTSRGTSSIFDVRAGDSPVIARRLGIQDIVYEGFQELPPEFA